MKNESVVLPRRQSEDLEVHEAVWDEDKAKEIVRRLNLKVTHQRLAILKILYGRRKHITAQELFEKVAQHDPEIGFATVYRFLRSLADGQIVTEVRMGGLPARYELTPQRHHDHMTCTECGKICEFENKSIENLQAKVAHDLGFTLTHHILELYGVCPACQSKAVKIK